ncbi:hypothetical protein OJ997_04940 [Solirubrobacter phytolaccae]|uniref:Uncharacterized protein n=1 Tax=Solirubrobacter phytolaccae TaxID=1404360 RepID=A0A9X3N4K4_9ACTN|nr:hypothetical protein [Solirubrobacter phytolaccae]MDA0179633.1 hypothetical protein [Solirubrobacter phytolaccae]
MQQRAVGDDEPTFHERPLRPWVNGSDLDKVWDTPAPEALAADLEEFPAALDDPFA